ncbi:hypothetical protein [Sphingomonas sp. 10B4]|uniref:hypothetical protein n=1 Tax=Sphingomonas sp. 10B4 TaxID=3048575 RepID=UPI002AB414D2|nr:hypothetical protein [Sphingomonas sp. 10B4]MDY7525491.1 hypothetical protein [Sphingomonas sp. 10B4]MEB0281435.1 hypothetical protein [Sphingomonas sp. 10B4]
MADQSAAANSLVTLISAAAYPLGTASPSVTGDAVKVFAGWPNPDALLKDMAAGTVNVSVFPRPGEKITSIMLGDTEWIDDSNTGTTGVTSRELRRQTKTFQITVWASCFDHRDAVANAIDVALSITTRIILSDGSTGIVSFVNSTQNDDQQKAGIYRRDLFYAVNYATVQALPAFNIISTVTTLTAGPTPDPTGPTVTITRP